MAAGAAVLVVDDVIAGVVGVRRRSSEDPRLDGVVHHHRAQCDDGRCLAPLSRVPQHLFRAGRSTVPRSARCSHGEQGQAGRLRDPGEDDIFGVGKVEDFTWKGWLDFSTCTECGRCRSRCPAWNTGKPLVTKLLVTNLRNHAYAKAPYLRAAESVRPELAVDVLAEAERPLVGSIADGGVIDPDVLWSCTTCGACVEQCPVDIEHVDHIVDMRRFQVLIESSFPSEAGVMLRNIENKGNPWGMNASARNNWIEEVDFPVRVFGADGEGHHSV